MRRGLDNNETNNETNNGTTGRRGRTVVACSLELENGLVFHDPLFLDGRDLPLRIFQDSKHLDLAQLVFLGDNIEKGDEVT